MGMDINKEEKRIKLTIVCDLNLTDAIADYLVGVLDAAVEVSIEDDMTEHILQAFIVGDADNREEVADLVSGVSKHLRELASIFEVSVPELDVAFFEEEDWSLNWKAHFRPFAIIPGLVIKPTWEQYTPVGNEKVIEMDPGMAFGTGHHATTSLCMTFIRDYLRRNASNGATVLDVGTGTGILAMAAALWGAGNVLGIDNDPVAVDAAGANVRLNKLEHKIDVETTALENVKGAYSLVVANIIHDVLLQMKGDLCRLTRAGGVLVLSGILREKQADNITNHFEAEGFELTGREEQDEWAALCLKKKSAPG
ncbi:50S ribosomal protein L11 methyltransferase [Desulfopila sp. IMCC35008]|uniref:50S ribosomal protein L11 methyltransferase n=1 Tax=Desulfopila sp. IMCC35008 TaxID=2653858 RepID=UPI0013D01D35|nr:50S ribosomal protein L11 methyltransferase [Desulfopila sp. IMCC35008]